MRVGPSLLSISLSASTRDVQYSCNTVISQSIDNPTVPWMAIHFRSPQHVVPYRRYSASEPTTESKIKDQTSPEESRQAQRIQVKIKDETWTNVDERWMRRAVGEMIERRRRGTECNMFQREMKERLGWDWMISLSLVRQQIKNLKNGQSTSSEQIHYSPSTFSLRSLSLFGRMDQSTYS